MRHSSFLEINLSYLQENLSKIKKMAKGTPIPMVKANAYGNGLVPVSQFLVNECEVRKLGCASLGEALHLFQSAPDLNTEVLVFSDTEILNPEIREAYLNYKITPVIHQMEELDFILGEKQFSRVPLVLKINTGMNRLGLSMEELEQVSPRLKGRGVKHLLTHFATSYYALKDGDKAHRQMNEFRKAQELLKSAGVSVEETSVANSGAIEQGFGVDETYVRPGLMLYGPYSVEPRVWDGHQISRLVTKVIKTFTVKKGTPVGYGINVAGEDGFVVIIPLGYGDGLLTYGSGVNIKINGFEGKIFARVNMDMAFIIFPMETAGKIKTGDAVEVWSHDNRVITDIANQMKTIPYQLMCTITDRVPRIYKVT